MPESSSADGLALRARIAYPRFQLDVSLSVSPGETLALVGPSAAGKSTCLSIIAGLVRPDWGVVVINGRTVIDTDRRIDFPPERRRVGFVFQDGALFPHMSLQQNVMFGAPREERTPESAQGWLDRVGLAGRGGDRIQGLSGGERQRLALARALAAKPDILLLDEPLSALDVDARSSVRVDLREFLASVRLPTILVTHDPTDALIFGDRIAIMEAGRIVQVGPHADLIHGPRSNYAGTLAGRNVYAVEIGPGPGLQRAESESLVFHVLAGGLTGAGYISFAPSEVLLSREKPTGSAQNVFRGRIVEIVPRPDRRQVNLDVGAPLAAEVTDEAIASLGLAPGLEVWASVKATAMQVYS